MHRNTAVDFKVSVLFNLLIIVQFPHRLYGATCPSACWCDGNNVNCNDKQLTAIPNNLPKDTFYLNMNNNHLRVLNLELLSSLPKLQFLTLRDNQISKVKASEFKQLTKLKTLDLHGNCLRTLKKAPFSTVQGLIYLDLSKNSLTSAEGIFKNLSHLVSLSLSDNVLTGFSNDVFVDTIHLEKLDIKNNKLKKLDLETFGHLKRLSVLELTRNDIHEITGSWQKSSHLQMLDLSQCQLADIPSNLPSSLKYLNIGSNRLTSITKSSLKNYRHLEILVLDHNQISSIESGSLLNLEKLHDLDLSDNSLSIFPGFLPKSLRDINLDRNNISVLTFHSFSRLTYLISLSLRNNKIVGFAQKSFSSLRSLKFLYMDGNPLKVLAENDLAEQRELEVLSLNNCPLERIELRPFIKLKALKELHLAFINNNHLSFNGAVLEELLYLEKLNLQGSPTLISRVVLTSQILASLQDKLKVLNIMNGYLTYLPPNFKDYLRNAQKIKLAGNPLHCDANLRWLHDWMKDEPDKFPHKDLITCATPDIMRGTPVHSLTESYFLSMPASSRRLSPQAFFPYSEVPASVEVSQEVIQDLDYADDLINYPVSGPQRDENCPSENVEEPRMSTNIKTEIFKYTSSVNDIVIDVSSPREHSRSEKTSTLCAACDSDINMTNHRLGELPQKSSTTQINDINGEEIREDNRNGESRDNIASVTANNNRLSDQVNWEGISSTKAWPDENNSPRSDSNNKISNSIVTITPLIHVGRLDDPNQSATSQNRVNSVASKDNRETTKFTTNVNSNTEFGRDDLFSNLKNKVDNNKNRIDDIGRESGDIPNIVKPKRDPPQYLKVAAIIASAGAGLLAVSTGLLIFFVSRFGKKTKARQVTSAHPLENC